MCPSHSTERWIALHNFGFNAFKWPSFIVTLLCPISFHFRFFKITFPLFVPLFFSIIFFCYFLSLSLVACTCIRYHSIKRNLPLTTPPPPPSIDLFHTPSFNTEFIFFFVYFHIFTFILILTNFFSSHSLNRNTSEPINPGSAQSNASDSKLVNTVRPSKGTQFVFFFILFLVFFFALSFYSCTSSNAFHIKECVFSLVWNELISSRPT